ncbi:ORF22 [black bullhead herpesvirus]|uniref:ORF22 n=1 Tax=black bullhead herpesvirus TaxID=508441 RepID=A0A2H5AJG2_9VIRU|nr:ORF22 [black bullhead herpesvirus]AUG72278.1 ORF22 [black bullhead herpesvirus]
MMLQKPRTHGDLSQNIRENLTNFGMMYSVYANRPSPETAGWILRGISQYLRTLFQTHLELMGSGEEGGSATVRFDILERLSALIDKPLGDGADVMGILEAQLSTVKDVIGACTDTGLDGVVDELGRLIRGLQKHEETLVKRLDTYIVTLTEGVGDLKDTGSMGASRVRGLNADSVTLAVAITPPPVTSFTTGPGLMAAVGHWGEMFSIFGLAAPQQSQKFLMNHPAQLDTLLMGLGVAYQTMTSKFRTRISQYKPPAIPTPASAITARPLGMDVPKQTNQVTTKTLVGDWRIHKLATGNVMGSLQGFVEDLLGGTVSVERGLANLDCVMGAIKGGGVIVAAAQLYEFRGLVDFLVDAVYTHDRDRFIATATTDVLGDYVIALTKVLDQMVTALVAIHGAIIELDPSFTQVGNNLRALVGVTTERDLLLSEREALFTNYHQAMGTYAAAVEEAMAVRTAAEALAEHNKKKSEIELQKQIAADTIKIQDLKTAHEKTLMELRTQNGLLKISGEEAQARVKGESFLQGAIADLQKTIAQLQERNTRLTQESGDREAARKVLETELKKRDRTISDLEADLKGARLSSTDQERAVITGNLTNASLKDRIKDLENSLKQAQNESATIRRERRAHRRRVVVAKHSRIHPGATVTTAPRGASGGTISNAAIHERCTYVKKTLAALNKGLTVKVARLEKELAQSDKNLRETAGKLLVEAGGHEDLKGRYAAATRELNELRVDRAEKVGGKRDAMETIANENTKLRIAVAAAEAQLQDVTAQLQDHRKNYVERALLTTVSKKVVTLTGELETHRKLEMKRAQERDASNRRIEALTLENGQLKVQVEATKNIEQLRKQLGTTTAQLGVEEGRRLTLNQELAGLKTINDQLNGQIKELTGELSRARRGGDTQIEKLKGQMTAKDVELAELKGGLEAARLSAANRGAEVKRLTSEIDGLRKTMATLQTKLESHTDAKSVEVGKQRGEVLRLTEELKIATEKQKTGDVRTKGLESRLVELENQLVIAGGRVAELEAQLMAASERLDERERGGGTRSERSEVPSTGRSELVAQSERSQASQTTGGGMEEVEAEDDGSETNAQLREENERIQALLNQGFEVAMEQTAFIRVISGRYRDLYEEFVAMVGHSPNTPPLSETEIPNLPMDEEGYDNPVVDDGNGPVDLMGSSFFFDVAEATPSVSGESVPMVALRGYSPHQDYVGSQNSQISFSELEPPVESGIERAFDHTIEFDTTPGQVVGPSDMLNIDMSVPPAATIPVEFDTTPGRVVGPVVGPSDTPNIDIPAQVPPMAVIPVSILSPPTPQPIPALRRSPRIKNKSSTDTGTPAPTPPRPPKRKGAGVDGKRVRVSVTASNIRKILSEKPQMTPQAIYQNIISGTQWDASQIAFMTQEGDLGFNNVVDGQLYISFTPDSPNGEIVWEQKRILLLMICVKHGIDSRFIVQEPDLSWFISYNEAKDVESTTPTPPVNESPRVIIEEENDDEVEEEEDDDL